MKEKRQNNSKKFMAIIAIVVMMGLIIGMGAITYSKYVTSHDAGTQTATAAKWGYVITADTKNLFGEKYQKDSTSTIAKVNDSGVSVAASNSVVAPGTTGSMTITIKGSAEVMAKLKFEGSATSEIALGDYKPVKWTLNDGSTDLVSKGTLKAVLTKLESLNKTIAANGSDLSYTYTITWEWSFNGDDTNDTIIGYKVNGKTYEEVKAIYDNALDNIVADKTAYDNIVTKIEFNLSVSIEQVLE